MYIDRTAQEVAKLTYHDMFELLTLKSEFRRQMEELRNEQLANSEDSDEESNNSTTEEEEEKSTTGCCEEVQAISSCDDLCA